MNCPCCEQAIADTLEDCPECGWKLRGEPIFGRPTTEQKNDYEQKLRECHENYEKKRRGQPPPPPPKPRRPTEPNQEPKLEQPENRKFQKRAVSRDSEGISSLAISNDRSLVASGSMDGSVRLWDAVNATDRGVFRCHQGGVTSVAVDLRGRWLGSASSDGTICVWRYAEINRGHTAISPSHKLEMPSGAHEALSLSFSNRGNILASGDERGNIHLWDFATGAPQSRRALRGRSARLNRLMFSPTRDQLASCGDDGIIKTWDIKTLESHDLDGPHNVHIRSTAYSPNGKWLASGGLNGAVTQWDLSSGVSYPLCNHGPEVSAIVYSADGRWLICGDRDGHIYVMDQKIGVELHHFKSATGINTLVYGSHQHTIVSGNQSGFIEWWEIPS